MIQLARPDRQPLTCRPVEPRDTSAVTRLLELEGHDDGSGAIACLMIDRANSWRQDGVTCYDDLPLFARTAASRETIDAIPLAWGLWAGGSILTRPRMVGWLAAFSMADHLLIEQLAVLPPHRDEGVERLVLRACQAAPVGRRPVVMLRDTAALYADHLSRLGFEGEPTHDWLVNPNGIEQRVVVRIAE